MGGSCRSFQFLFAAAALLAAWLLGPVALGQQSYWLNQAGGNYEDGSNWSLGSAGQDPTFNLGSSGYNVNLGSNDGAVEDIIETDNPTFVMNGGTYTNAYLAVATQSGWNGSLTLQGPGTFTQDQINDSFVDVGTTGGIGQLTINDATLVQDGQDMQV